MKPMKSIFAAFTLADLHNSLIIQELMKKYDKTPADVQKHIKEMAEIIAEPYHVHRRRRRKRTKAELEARKKMLKETIYGPIKPRP